MKKSNFFKLITCIIICQLAGLIGSIFTFSAIPNWYNYLAKPELNPPSWIFGPVWTTLYLMMGIALFLVWQKGLGTKFVKKSLVIFYLQLGLNAVWSILFFGLKSPFAALIDIVILWAAILWTILTFYKISKPAAYLLIPYILWVSFASYLNYMIWYLN